MIVVVAVTDSSLDRQVASVFSPFLQAIFMLGIALCVGKTIISLVVSFPGKDWHWRFIGVDLPETIDFWESRVAFVWFTVRLSGGSPFIHGLGLRLVNGGVCSGRKIPMF